MANTDYEQMARDLISNISYTNKDFRSIYPELIDLVKKLTNKWDPEITNESDPGLILLKLNAIIADKNNYNIDKNILEAFPLSVTQYGNARKIYDILGYKMKWYRSATATLSMVSNYDDLTSLKFKSPGSENIIFPIFTMFSNDSGDNVYTLTKSVTASNLAKGIPQTNLPVIEGTNYAYELNGDTLITLNHLDADLRLYFKEPYVAENGIFIKNSTETSWDKAWIKVDNLAAETLNQKIFEFGVTPNSNICYIQFPQDIGNLIGDGLNIQYVISSGVKGNVSAKEINTCTVDIIATKKDGDSAEINLNDYINILNPDASTNGADPESLDEAYKNYKKIVGTFNTLVTCRDYENYIYNMKNSTEDAVSNIVVSDRTNDLNSIYVQLDEDGVNKKQFVKATYGGTTNTKEFTAYDLALAPLKPVSSIYDNSTFNATFELDSSTKATLEDSLQAEGTVSCIQHDYIDNTHNPIVLFKNKFTVNAKILTYYKLSNEEIKDLKKQIQQALRLKYNSRKLEFGESIAYDELVNTIENSDSRIRAAIVDVPTYTTYTSSYSGDSLLDATLSENAAATDIYANMVMRGNTQLIDFNKDFNWQFGQVSAVEYDGITSITSEVTIPKTALAAGYTLEENENIQALSPSYITTQTISSYVRYAITNNKSGAGDITFSKDVVYKMSDSDWNLKFDFARTLEDGTTNEFSLDSNNAQYFRLNFNLTLTGNTPTTGDLQSSYKVESLKQNTTDLSDKLCYWLLNNNENILFKSTDVEKILDTNEYFIYTDRIKSGIVILGSGTKITRPQEGAVVRINKNIPAEQIAESGVSSIPDSAFYTWPQGSSVTAHEMVIYTFGKGTKVTATVTNPVNNNLQNCSNLKYQNPGEAEQELKGTEWQIRSRLNINATPSSPQVLGTNQNLKIHYTSTTNPVTITGKSILFNENVQLAGGTGIDTSVLDLEGNVNYSLNALVFADETSELHLKLPYVSKTKIISAGILKENAAGSSVDDYTWDTFIQSNSGNYFIQPKDLGSDNNSDIKNIATIKTSQNTDPQTWYIKVNGNASNNQMYEEVYSLTLGSGKTALIKLYVSGASSTNKVTVTKTGNGSIKDYTTGTPLVNNEITSNGVYYLLLTGPLSTINISIPNVEGISTTLDRTLYRFDEEPNVNVKNKIRSNLEDTGYKFDYTYIVPDDVKIDDPLDPDSFWSSNHYCSKFTIAQLDLDNSKITIL